MSKKKIIVISLIIPIILALITIAVYAVTRNITEDDFLTANDIFCISKSQPFYAGEYTVGSEFTVGNSDKERALAYAICSRTEDSSNNYTEERVNHKGDSAQWAVWKLIGDGNNFTYFKDYTLSQDVTVDGEELSITKDMYKWNQPWRYAIYDRAMAYANYSGVNAPSSITISEKTSDNKIKIDLGNYNTSASFTDTNPSTYGHNRTTVTLNDLGGVKSVKITADGTTTTYTGNNLKNHLDSSRYFVLENAGGIGMLQVEVTYYEVKYTAKGNVLTKASSQTLMSAKGNKTEELTTKTAEKVFNTDVSLQKYIIKVNGKDLTNNETAVINRENMYYNNIDAKEEQKHPSPGNIVKRTNIYKGYEDDNVVKIEAGDTVTYRIYVYNNSDVIAKKIPLREEFLYYKIKGENNLRNYENYEIISITRDGKNQNIKNQWERHLQRESLTHEYKYEINNLPAKSSTYFDITVKLNEYLKSESLENEVIANEASIPPYTRNSYWDNKLPTEMKQTDPNNETAYRTLDKDYIKMKPYKASLQKIVYSVNGTRQGDDRWESWESTANVNNSPADETYNRNNLYAKHNNPVTVANGDTVTYAVRVRNDYDTQVKITQITDDLPTGVSLQSVTNESGNEVSYTTNEQTIIINEETRLLNKDETYTYFVTVKVTESNMSTKLLRNYAKITGIKNKNNVDITDTTESNNDDADYIQLKDIVISGTVWNDKALDKKQDNYNGVYDEGKENKLSGIKVMLYREGKGIISTTTTDDNGNYTFDASKIDGSVVTEQCERHIKAPYTCKSTYSGSVVHDSNYWKENNYYSYYVLFEYDGIIYTSTAFSDVTSNNDKDSNAKEDNGQVKETRQAFNNRFSVINKDSGINYNTKNEEGFLPQSNHVYNSKTMAMQSSTNKISLSNTASLEEQLTHVNLGLRGRDVFDLELTSDVYSTKVTVNGQSGEYKYNNKVTVRKSDISVAEDAANFANEIREAEVGEIGQAVRNTDIDKNKTNSNYDGTGLGIEVTYKITVTNAALTEGTATKVINYYDNKYTFKEAYSENNKLNVENGNSGSSYKSVIITTLETNLSQGDSMEIYVVYTLDNPTNTLKSLVDGTTTKIPTYNMAEIYEYSTQCASGQTEYTRGLIDKDSAPGRVAKENVRLTPNAEGSVSTLEYYFGGNDLSKLKYEDDTYATPTLYFTSTENTRTLSGFVFRDATTTNNETRIKTGNGVKDEGEVGVYGATVELVELNDKTKSPENITNSDGIVRYTVNTKEDGSYTFSNFLPGNYVIRYHYGDTTKTVLLNQSGDVNKYSFNGEDYQSTNNIGAYGAKALKGYNAETSKFENTTDWYAYNEKEGVSTGTDNTAKRIDVSKTVTDYTDEKMTILNNVRDNKDVTETEVNKLIEDTSMYATTPNFTLSVEKTETDSNNQNIIPKTAFSEYQINNMNFGIAEVPVTTIDLQKHVAGFTIKESAGDNIIASLTKQEDGSWKTIGDTKVTENVITAEIEDEKLQGARLEVTYDITANIVVEKNFDGKEVTKATINSLVDYIDNDLSYNENLGQNGKFWEVTTYEDTNAIFKTSEFTDSNGNKKERKGKLDPEGKVYTQIVKAKVGNPLLESSSGSVPITLEKVISASDYTIEDIITSNINTFEYDNSVEITKIEYTNTSTDATGDNFVFRDRVRTPSRNIILAGSQYDYATSETLSIIPPLGENNSIIYYIIAAVSLVVLAGGIVLIKKYAIKKD